MLPGPWCILERAGAAAGPLWSWLWPRSYGGTQAAIPGHGGAGSEGPVFSVSHLYGFGLVDADALVVEAKKWMAVPPQHTCVAITDKRPR